MEITKLSRDYTIRSYECDRNNQLRMITLMNIFQDMAYAQVTQMEKWMRISALIHGHPAKKNSV